MTLNLPQVLSISHLRERCHNSYLAKSVVNNHSTQILTCSCSVNTIWLTVSKYIEMKRLAIKYTYGLHFNLISKLV